MMLVEIRRLYLCSGENKFCYYDDDDDYEDIICDNDNNVLLDYDDHDEEKNMNIDTEIKMTTN